MEKIATIKSMVQEAERHADDLSAERILAMEYYQGTMKDTPSDEGRSAMVSRDVRDHIKKVLPSLVRTLMSSTRIVEYQPVGENDEAGAEQATDYVNHVIAPDCDLERVLYDAVHDALLLRNGIIKWWWQDEDRVSISRHTGLTVEALAELADDDSVEILESAEYIEQTELGDVMLYDVKVRRTFRDRKAMLGVVPRENFLIHPDATSVDDSLITGEKTTVRRGDLISMGYDPKLVRELSQSDDDDTEDAIRRDMALDGDEVALENQEIDYYDLYLRIDMDGDGVSELRHMIFAGGLSEKNLLENEECDDVQCADISVMMQPHQWEGISLYDDLRDVQRAKTVLLRQTLDNLYWQNNPQPIFQEGAVTNPEAVYNPEFGKPITVARGTDVRAALGFNTVPFVARDSFSMLEYMDQEASDRTGISDASAGLAPDALQNMTAKASAMIEQAGIGQTEMMVRMVAMGLRKVFRGLLRLIIRHQDVPRTVRLRDEWVTFDPRQWNADMDCSVNTGLGAGTRERDMIVMQQVLGLQEKLLTMMGADNPFVKPENLYNTLSRLVESAGLKTVDLYFTEPDPDEVAEKMQAMKNKPSPEQIKAEEAKMKVQSQMQLEQAKMVANRDKEKAQMEADLTVKQAEIAAETERQRLDLESKAALKAQEIQWEREKLSAQHRFDREQAEIRRQDEIWKAQAAGLAQQEVM
ncbi:portal protein [Celeribacter sp. SCSIO 80788]|uniref:portal protein n=1 Tax=Celeribacter sp. SCSIO 80788 TaxID=3117013 RepID=UPI003DA54971